MNRVGRIVLWDEHEVDDSLWMPLIVFLARAKDEGVYPPLLHWIDFRDFMLMHGVERKPRPFLYAYKHVESRRYVFVDKEGAPYRFLPRGDDGQYRTSDFTRAVYGLDPWFIRDAGRPSREEEYVGDDDLDIVDRRWPADEPMGRHHLRVVR